MNNTFIDAFPLESLGSDIARNNYNYEAIFNGLIEWNSSKNDTVTVRLTKNTYPYFHDYTFPTKNAGVSSLGKDSVTPVASNAFAYDAEFPIVASASPDDRDSDKVTLRINVANSGRTAWKPYMDAYINVANPDSTDYIKGSIIRRNNGGDDLGLWLVVNQDYSNPKTIDQLVAADWIKPLIVDFEANMMLYNGMFVVYNNELFICRCESSFNVGVVPPSKSSAEYTFMGNVWTSNGSYNKGDYVAHKDEDGIYHLFINLITDEINSSNPDSYLGYWSSADGEAYYTENTDADKRWQEAVLLPIYGVSAINKSKVIRFTPSTDISGVVLRNVGQDYAELSTSIGIIGNIQYRKPESIYNKKVGIFESSNYAMYPLNQNGVWTEGRNIETNSDFGLNKRQGYSASMIFDHGRSDISTINYVNYDGPDLDQGLCIYLTTESDTTDGVSKPEDGYTFEFFFRIWPNTNLNNAVTADHIINKSQIYVYSAKNIDEIKSDGCSTPIAKFSMARLTNFYVFDENIGIANRPVMYRATFVYSATDEEWKLFDYYQLPDHVFVGPIGFIDPTNSGVTDINGESGNEFAGLETAGFPMFADPFDRGMLK